MLVPSIWDTFNLTCAEAMGYGRVVLCSEGAGARDLVEDGVSGLRFRSGDPAALAQAVERYLDLGDTARREMGECAREGVRRALDPEAVTDRRLRAYETLGVETRRPLRPNEWLATAARPHQALSRPYGFLEQYPLRELVVHSVRRTMRKLAG